MSKIINQTEINQIKNNGSAKDFFEAIKEGNLQAIKIYVDLKLIDLGTIKDEYEATPRIVAINASQPEVIKYLDEILGRPNLANDVDMTDLFGADIGDQDIAG